MSVEVLLNGTIYQHITKINYIAPGETSFILNIPRIGNDYTLRIIVNNTRINGAGASANSLIPFTVTNTNPAVVQWYTGLVLEIINFINQFGTLAGILISIGTVIYIIYTRINKDVRNARTELTRMFTFMDVLVVYGFMPEDEKKKVFGTIPMSVTQRLTDKVLVGDSVYSISKVDRHDKERAELKHWFSLHKKKSKKIVEEEKQERWMADGSK